MREDFEVNPRRPKKAGIIFAISFVVIIALIGLYVLGASSKKEVPIISPTPTTIPTLVPVSTSEPTPEEVTPTRSAGSGQAKPTSAPTPTPKSSSSEKNIEVTVLNGSGVAGAAKTISTYLEGLGYTIKSTGNADTYDYQGITITVSKDKSSYLTQLKKDLSEKSATVSGSVDNNLTVDAQVIVGK